MPAISVQIILSPGKTRRETFSEPVISFGRGPDNLIVVPATTVSREHGELRYEDDQWLLVNLSPNGTRVNGKNVTRKPRVLRDRDVVAVGDEPIFHVVLGATSITPADEEPAAADDSATPTKPNRNKLWIGLGVYFLLMIGLVIFLSTLGQRPDDQAPAPELTVAQIKDEILKPMKVDVVDPRKSQESLETATEFFNKMDAAPGNLFKAYRAYQLALAYAGQDHFTDDLGLNQRRFIQVQDTLVQNVTNLYTIGYGQLHSLAFKDSEATFRKLEQEVYQDSSGVIYRNIERQRKAAAAGFKKQNR